MPARPELPMGSTPPDVAVPAGTPKVPGAPVARGRRPPRPPGWAIASVRLVPVVSPNPPPVPPARNPSAPAGRRMPSPPGVPGR
ncbi:hypothetical protein ABZ356_20870, partial [Micromonospora zamorensis]